LDLEVLDCACGAEQVISKSSAAEDVGKVGVCSILLWDAKVALDFSKALQASSPMMKPGKQDKKKNVFDTHLQDAARQIRKEKKSHTGNKTLPAPLKEKETQWP